MVADSSLEAVLAALDERAGTEPRLERYRVIGRGVDALADVPPGWFVSHAITRIATEGGWWPGRWWFPMFDDVVPSVLAKGRALHFGHEAAARWIGVGSIWERDQFYTPALRQPSPTAPLYGFSNQALWSSMVFPTEAAVLEAFLVTYDDLGLDERGEVNPFFVEWVTQAPGRHEPAGAARVHRRLTELSTAWTTAHRCWVPGAMPRMDEEAWPPELVARIFGVDDTRT
jgi:hypothetical protein